MADSAAFARLAAASETLALAVDRLDDALARRETVREADARELRGKVDQLLLALGGQGQELSQSVAAALTHHFEAQAAVILREMTEIGTKERHLLMERMQAIVLKQDRLERVEARVAAAYEEARLEPVDAAAGRAFGLLRRHWKTIKWAIVWILTTGAAIAATHAPHLLQGHL